MDEHTFELFIRDHIKFIRCLLSRRGVRPCDLDDIAQEVVCAIFRGLPSFDPSLATTPELAAEAWVYGICGRQAANYRRARRRRAEVFRDPRDVDGLSDTTAPSVEDLFFACETNAALARALDAMEPFRRDVMVAHELHDVPMAEIAHRQGVSVNTAWNRLRLARADVRAAIHDAARSRQAER